MPTTLERRAAVAHRRTQLRLTALTVDELRRLWPLLDPDNLTDTTGTWLNATTAAIASARERHIAAATTYLTAIDLVPVIATPPLATDAVLTSLRVTGPVRLERAAVTFGVAPPDVIRMALRESARAGSRHAVNGARDTILAQHQAYDVRFRRLTSAGACDFCKMLASRGAVYWSQMTAGFQAHDGCACQPAAEKVSS